jgi:NTE family protein
MVSYRVIAWLTALLVVSGCASLRNEPVNKPIADVNAAAAIGRNDPAYADDLLVGLSFSGGGTRAAAFSFGVLGEIDRTHIRSGTTSVSLLDHLDFISGVSGGSVTAAYFGLKKRAAFEDFRENFLLRNAEESIDLGINLLSISRAVAGGINDSTQFPPWLDDNLFHGATLGEFRETRRPRIWINASDIYNRTPFVFGATAFRTICSDLNNYPISNAVAASAAVPVVFAPVVIKTFPQECHSKLPEWVERARRNPKAAPLLKAFADGLARYHNGEIPYIKLLDGGLVDNFGISGFTIARLSSETPYGPLTPRQAVALRRLLFLVVDAGRGPGGDWVNRVEGPGGADLVMAAADTAVDAGVRVGYSVLETTQNEWQAALVRWRCGLSAAQRREFGAPPNWNCRDLKFFIGHLTFDQLDAERAQRLNAIPTRFKLPAADVDLLIDAGADSLRSNDVFKAFLASLR